MEVLHHELKTGPAINFKGKKVSRVDLSLILKAKSLGPSSRGVLADGLAKLIGKGGVIEASNTQPKNGVVTVRISAVYDDFISLSAAKLKLKQLYP